MHIKGACPNLPWNMSMHRNPHNYIVVCLIILILLYFEIPQKVFHIGFGITQIIVKQIEYKKQLQKKAEHELTIINNIVNKLEKNTLEISSKNKVFRNIVVQDSDIIVDKKYNSISDGMPDIVDSIVSLMDEAAKKANRPAIFYPYRVRLKEIDDIIAKLGYDKHNLHMHYNELKTNNCNINTPKVENILLLSHNNKSDVFWSYIDTLFQDKNNIGYLLLKLDFHHSFAMIDDVFIDAKKIISIADELEISGVDKRAVIYYALRTATLFGYITENTIVKLKQQHNDYIGIGCVDILKLLEIANNLY